MDFPSMMLAGMVFCAVPDDFWRVRILSRGRLGRQGICGRTGGRLFLSDSGRYELDPDTVAAYYCRPSRVGNLVLCRNADWLVGIYRQSDLRGIAQSGSAPALGAGCREFKSLYPDQYIPDSRRSLEIRSSAPVAQLDRASAFKCAKGCTEGASSGKQNLMSGSHCIGETLTADLQPSSLADGNPEETVG